MNVWNCIINKDGKLISTPSMASDAGVSRAVALGYFDGIHLGHQKIFATMLEEAKKFNIRTAVQTFENPPASKSQNNLITTYTERCRMVSHMGIDDLFALPFNERVKGMSPETFMDVCLKDWIKAKVVVVGRDYHFGKDRAGDVKTLKAWGKKNDVTVISVDPINYDDRRISSSWVRELISSGEVEMAEKLLDHPVAFSGVVEKGQQIGRKLGFPTANIRIPEQKIVPRFGVYVSAYLLDGVVYPSVTNIGLRPTVNKDDESPLTETMILEGHYQLYGTNGTVMLLKFVRPEQKFISLEELKEQMQKDQKAALEYHKSRQIPVRFEGYV